MNTANLNLEEIVMNDTLNGTMLEKMNNNMQKIDERYGKLKNALLEQTGKDTLEDAIGYVQALANQMEFLNTSGDATASAMLEGKTAVVNGKIVTGTIPSMGSKVIMPRNFTASY